MDVARIQAKKKRIIALSKKATELRKEKKKKINKWKVLKEKLNWQKLFFEKMRLKPKWYKIYRWMMVKISIKNALSQLKNEGAQTNFSTLLANGPKI